MDSLLGRLGKNLARAAGAVRSAFNDDPHEILAYRAYGDSARARIYGRALEQRGVSASTDADSTLRNLLNTYRRAESDPLPFARVNATYAGRSVGLTADDEGFFTGFVEANTPVEAKDGWTDYEVELIAPLRQGERNVRQTGEVLVPPASSRFAVISDIDDTVIQSRISNFLQAARTVMLGNARTRLPFPGVAAFYEALRKGASGDEHNPVFYVSSSPWNIYDVITEFMDLQKIPRGPLLLRDWDIGLGALSSSRHFEHKGVAIREIMRFYPHLEFILIGDSSQHDPEIYHQIVSEFPKRVKAIYIRDVTRSEERTTSVKKLAAEVLAAHSTLVLAEDTYGAAVHAAEQGWIDPDTLPDVREEKRADEGRDDTKAPAPDGGQPGSGKTPTVIGTPGN